jgi:hypothetical protein
MGTRGRDSAAALSVVVGQLETIARPSPPDDLTHEQCTEWDAVVDRMPADWFPRETHGMLAQYCRHVVSARRVAQLIAAAEQAEQFDINGYDQLLKMQEREGRALSSLATRMRLSQQTNYDKSKKKPLQSKTPWDFGKQG